MGIGHDHNSDSGRRRSLLPVQLDTCLGDEVEDFDSWLFHVSSVSKLERWSSELRLRHAAVAVAGGPRAEYRAFVATTLGIRPVAGLF